FRVPSVSGDGAPAAAITTPPPSTNGANGGVALKANGGATAEAAIARPSLRPQGAAPKEEILHIAGLQGRVYALINAYRVRGHLFANLDPLGTPPEAARELDLANFGLSPSDLDLVFANLDVPGLPERPTLRQIIAHLAETYCSSIGVEY